MILPVRLLVVDPNDEERDAAARVLRQAGFLVETACDSTSTRDRLRATEAEFHVALLTPKLREEDGRRSGLELAREIVEHSARCLTLLMIGSGDSPYCRDFPVVRKPFDAVLLPSRIAAALAQRGWSSGGIDSAATMRNTMAKLIEVGKFKRSSRAIEVIVIALLGIVKREEVAELQGTAPSTTRDTITDLLARVTMSGLGEALRRALELEGVDFRAFLSQWIERADVLERVLRRLERDRESRQRRRARDGLE